MHRNVGFAESPALAYLLTQACSAL